MPRDVCHLRAKSRVIRIRRRRDGRRLTVVRVHNQYGNNVTDAVAPAQPVMSAAAAGKVAPTYAPIASSKAPTVQMPTVAGDVYLSAAGSVKASAALVLAPILAALLL
ncbi:hypothetical protein HK101_001693 [Irineochytrium annulatum]|nr:hypothetical protein HK101_001693 [Irineochytrium annulatum]